MAIQRGLEKHVAKLQRLVPAVLKRMVTADDKLADEAVAQIRAIAPVDPSSPDPGAYRDSVRREPGKEPNSVKVVAGAPGFPAVAHLEFGHKTPSGGHVAAEPSYYPVIRLIKKKRRSRQRTAIKAGIRDAGGI